MAETLSYDSKDANRLSKICFLDNCKSRRLISFRMPSRGFISQMPPWPVVNVVCGTTELTLNLFGGHARLPLLLRRNSVAAEPYFWGSPADN
jgi:hypothetical protein